MRSFGIQVFLPETFHSFIEEIRQRFNCHGCEKHKQMELRILRGHAKMVRHAARWRDPAGIEGCVGQPARPLHDA